MVLPPLLCRAMDNNNEDEARTMVNYTVKGFLLLAIPFTVGSCIMGKPLLTILANSEVAQNSYLVVPIVSLGTLFYGLSLIISNIFFVQMATTVMFKMSLIAAFLNVILNLIFLYVFEDIMVAAITTFISYFFCFRIRLPSSTKDLEDRFCFSGYYKIHCSVCHDEYFIVFNISPDGR